jgi:hypothetical protein
MARSRAKSNKKFVMFEHGELKVPAWTCATVYERAAIFELRRKYNGHNNGKVEMSARELGRLINVHRNTAWRALKGIEDKGWAIRVFRGNFGLGVKEGSEWRLTNQPYGPGVGERPTREYMRWRPTDEN